MISNLIALTETKESVFPDLFESGSLLSQLDAEKLPQKFPEKSGEILTKSRFFVTCPNCMRLAIRQCSDDLTILENSCRFSVSVEKMCSKWQPRHHSRKLVVQVRMKRTKKF